MEKVARIKFFKSFILVTFRNGSVKNTLHDLIWNKLSTLTLYSIRRGWGGVGVGLQNEKKNADPSTNNVKCASFRGKKLSLPGANLIF